MGRRALIQAMAALLQNGYFKGFVTGRVYSGRGKNACVPGLNCHSCPGAVSACPLGSLQNGFARGDIPALFYVLGFLVLAGLVLGRAVCGFLCPFGLVQELLHKIPLKKWRERPWLRTLSKLKYLVLAVFVAGIPLGVMLAGGVSFPAFCQWLCPAGTLEAGIPLVLLNPEMHSALGFLYVWRIALLAFVIFWAIVRFRPFCRFLCPLGACYALFNRVSLLQIAIDEGACTRCGECRRACKMEAESACSGECIRCGECVRSCPQKALRWRLGPAAKPKTAPGAEEETP